MLRKQSNTIYYVLLLTSIFLFRFLLFNHVYIFFLLRSTSSSKRIFLLSDSSTNDDGFQFDPCSKNKVSSERQASYFFFSLVCSTNFPCHHMNQLPGNKWASEKAAIRQISRDIPYNYLSFTSSTFYIAYVHGVTPFSWWLNSRIGVFLNYVIRDLRIEHSNSFVLLI